MIGKTDAAGYRDFSELDDAGLEYAVTKEASSGASEAPMT